MDGVFKLIFLYVFISIKLSLEFNPKCVIKKYLLLVQIMDWHQTGDKPLSKFIDA